MTERVKVTSACIKTSSLFEFVRMSIYLKNAPQIYQRMIDNAINEYVKIGVSLDTIAAKHVNLIYAVTDGERIPICSRRFLNGYLCIDYVTGSPLHKIVAKKKMAIKNNMLNIPSTISLKIVIFGG